MNLILHLPFPISVNNYYMLVGRRKILSARGRLFKESVSDACHEQGAHGLSLDIRLCLAVILYPPDRRVRDIDNCMKSLLDSLTLAEVFTDDRLIDQLMIYRGAVRKGGSCTVLINEGGPIIPDGYSITLL